jgi:hypothetical protein
LVCYQQINHQEFPVECGANLAAKTEKHQREPAKPIHFITQLSINPSV